MYSMGQGDSSVVQHLPGRRDVVSLIPVTKKENQETSRPLTFGSHGVVHSTLWVPVSGTHNWRLLGLAGLSSPPPSATEHQSHHPSSLLQKHAGASALAYHGGSNGSPSASFSAELSDPGREMEPREQTLCQPAVE